MNGSGSGVRRIGLALGIVSLALAGGACNCGGLDMTIAVPPSPTRADGKSPAVIAVAVARGGKPVADTDQGTVKLTTDLGQFGAIDISSGIPPADDPGQQVLRAEVNSGAAKALLYSVRSGTANVNVTYTDQYGSSVQKTAKVAFGGVGSGKVASIQYEGASPSWVNLVDSGGQTTSQVTFRLLDESGSPVIDGVAVAFSLSQNPGDATFSPATAKTANGTGEVQTVLSAGYLKGTVKVVATADGATVASDPITIAGGPANQGNITFSCDHYSVGGFEHDGLVLNCTVFVSDRNGNFSPNTQVTFMSEAGSTPRQIATEPASPDDPANSRGRAVIKYQTQCPWPEDVPPNPGEPSTNCTFFNQCNGPGGKTEQRACNPRDGVATLVAYTTGEECYTDVNGNGKYDPGEPMPPGCDVGEPYVDANDNGQWDPGEQFYDANKNGRYDGPDDQWDGQTAIWKAIKVTWTGAPVVTTVTPADLGTVAHCTESDVTFTFADINGNMPTANGFGDVLNVVCNGNCLAPADLRLQDTTATGYTIRLNDGHDCSSPTPAPPASFNVDLHLVRTLDGDGTATKYLDLPGVTKGTYQ